MFGSKDLLFSSEKYGVAKSLRFRSSASAYLNRTFASGNRKTWTWSAWVKRGTLTTNDALFHVQGSSTNTTYFLFRFDSTNGALYAGNASTNFFITSQVFRDPSAWYHIVLTLDTTQATANDRLKLYINGAQVPPSAFSSNNIAAQISQNSDQGINQAVAHIIGRENTGVFYLDGYLAEVNFIDGQALTPSSFGFYDNNGIWQPQGYTGTYGTNGFYLKFTDVGATSGANTGYGKDFSGFNTNYWTTNNFGTTSTGSSAPSYDSMWDSPTNFNNGGNNVGNYCVLNPVSNIGNGTISNGNLSYTSGSAAWKCSSGTIFASTGKWYFEATLTSSSSSAMYGVINNNFPYSGYATYPGASPYGWAVQSATGGTTKWNNNSFTTIDAVAQAANDVYMVAFDVDAGKIWFGKNGTWYSSGDPANGTNAAYTNLTGQISPVISTVSASDIAALNCGQRPLIYTPPSGFSALNTQNLTTPTITNGASYMAAVLYTGTGSSQTITTSSSNSGNNPNGTTFQPDWVWVKGRSGATDHALYDAVRGVQLQLESNTTTAETTETTGLTAFTSSGFTTGALAQMNTNTATYVAWEWNAGGSTVTNTSGSITSSVRANTSAGFSVVTYTGNGTTGATVGHGLGVVPSMVIVRERGNINGWYVYHTSLGNTKCVYLDSVSAQATVSIWNNKTPTSSVIEYNNGAEVNRSSGNYAAYFFAPVSGYSAIGSYVGNGSTDGAFIYTGFRPRWLLTKDITAASDWYVYDTARDTYNAMPDVLNPNTNAAESNGRPIDFVSNGFKLRVGSATNPNVSGDTYIYMAFAENPFKISRAR